MQVQFDADPATEWERKANDETLERVLKVCVALLRSRGNSESDQKAVDPFPAYLVRVQLLLHEQRSSPTLDYQLIVSISFINTLETNESWLPGNFDLPSSTIKVFREAGLSGVLLCNLYSRESYWAKMGNQRFLLYDDQGRLEKLGIASSTRFYEHANNNRQRSATNTAAGGTQA